MYGMCEENRIATEVVDSALKLHKHCGPGVYENVYEATFGYELKKRGLASRSQTPVPVVVPISLNLCDLAFLREFLVIFIFGSPPEVFL
jgi:GxxExxY protein